MIPLVLSVLPSLAVLLFFGPGADIGSSLSILIPATVLFTLALSAACALFAAVGFLCPSLRGARAAAEAHSGGDFEARAQAAGLVREGAELADAVNAVGEAARKTATEQAGARRVDVAAGKALDSLLAGLSHDVRRPLNTVVGVSYLALRSNPEPRLLACLENIYAAGIRLLKIIGTVMELSRINAGKLGAPRTPVSPADTVAEIRRHLHMPALPAGKEPEDAPVRRALVAGGDGQPSEEAVALLEKVGFSVAQAEDSGAARIILEQACAVGEPFDLLLLDRHVPDAAVMETVRHIRNSARIRPAPLIFILSAYGRKNIRLQAEEAGVDAFLHKPAHEATLRAAVEKLSPARADGPGAPGRTETGATDRAEAGEVPVEEKPA
ncbi:MAG: response regulator [Desulfovibrio sp.]|nr:response regulator [Desulfovibrio sp.]